MWGHKSTGYCVQFMRLLFQRHGIFLLHHGDSFILPLMTFLYSLKDAYYLHNHNIPVKVSTSAFIGACYLGYIFTEMIEAVY